MTWNEAQERARQIWGQTVQISPRPGKSTDWWVDVPGEASVQRMDTNGHVVCHHDTCVLKEGRLR